MMIYHLLIIRHVIHASQSKEYKIGGRRSYILRVEGYQSLGLAALITISLTVCKTVPTAMTVIAAIAACLT